MLNICILKRWEPIGKGRSGLIFLTPATDTFERRGTGAFRFPSDCYYYPHIIYGSAKASLMEA